MAFKYKEFEAMYQNLHKVQKFHEKFVRDFLYEMGLRCLAKTKKRTPVDTGDLRNHWSLSDVWRKGDDLVIYLSNSMEYASHVEYGHRKRNAPLGLRPEDRNPGNWVEGYFMATLSIAEIEAEMPARYDAALKKFLSGLEVK